MYGFCVERQFCPPEEVRRLKDEMGAMVDENWNPGGGGGGESFGTDSASNSNRGDYFLDSAGRVSYFAEPHALDDETGELKETFRRHKVDALNKAGHGMHVLPGTAFHRYTQSDKVRRLVLDLGWQDPVVPQSMYIFKQPQVGGTVHSHQDSSFLYTTPKQSCLGLWLALDDATLDNGCLWVRPQSHHEPVRRRFVRNPDYDFDDPTKNDPNTKKLIFVDPSAEGNGDPTDPTTNPTRPNGDTVTWEGGLPESVELCPQPELQQHDGDDDDDRPPTIFRSFVPVEVSAGDLVVFCGTLDHFSLPNFSTHPRHTFQLHLVDNTVQWSPQNWLQYPKGQSFLRLGQSDP
jgi:phytanoyl-CoA hydroxylase